MAKDHLILFWTLAVLALPLFVLVATPTAARPRLPVQRNRTAPWDGTTVLAIFAIMNSHLFVSGLFPKDWPAPWPQLYASIALIGPQVVLALILLVPFPYAGRLSFRRFANNAAIGVIAWSSLTPAVYALQFVLQWLMHYLNLATQEHQFITELRKSESQTWAWTLMGVEAILLAPFREEFAFRAVLQPWAIGRQWGGDLMFAFAIVLGYSFLGDVSWALGIQPLVFIAIVLGALVAHEQFWSRRSVTVPGWWRYLFPEVTSSSSIGGPQMRRAIVGTSVLFAMMHSRTWPDPVPLTLLGLGLGWLAWRTQSLVAPFACHALFNAFSLAQLRVIINSQ